MRSVLLLLVVAATAAPAHAQFVQSYGVRVGVNSSHVTFDLLDGDDAFDSRFGFQVAAFAELGAPLFPVSALIEVEYAQRGYETSYTLTSPTGEDEGTQTASTTLHYLSVPLLARVRLPGALMVTPYAVAGPRIDVLAGYDPGEIGCLTVTGDCSEIDPVRDPFPELFPTMSFSGVVGAGVALSELIGPEVRAEVRYSLGLTDLNDGEALEMKNRGLDFAIVLAF